jgi:uroporphyrinogen III methyltransferase/synthase
MGTVILVGAGPGDPGLMTVRGLEVLRAADVVLYDRLLDPNVLAECRRDAQLIYAGKGPGGMKQSEINAALVEHAQAGHTVCRLKGGDPFLFGRGGEEASYLVSAGVPFEVVPGVTSAIAAPAYAGIPVTDRRFASTVAMVTGHAAEDEPDRRPRWRELNGADTLVVLMAVGALSEVARELIEAGRDAQQPAAVIEQGATPKQRVVVARLENVAAEAEAAGIKAPAVVVVGQVVELRQTLAWAEQKPLWGRRVLVTRPAGQAEPLSAALRAAGAEAIEFPCIEVRELPADAAMLALIERRYEWTLFVSANGARAAAAALRAAECDSRAFPPGRIGTVGPGTAAAVEGIGLRVDFMPAQYTVAALAAGLPGSLEGKAVLLPGRAEVNPRLRAGLTARGAEIVVWPVYEIALSQPRLPLAEVVGAGVDVVALTSASAARAFVELAGKEAAACALIACIGPPTAEAARDAGLKVDMVADEHTTHGLVAAIVEHMRGRPG